VLTKKDFEKVFERLEVLIKKNDKFDDYWVSASDFQKIKDIIDHEFFHTCWEYSPDSMKNSMPWRWLKTWLPCYCGGQDVTGVALKLPIKHDFVINTATTNPTDCAIVLNNWFAERMLKK
jgi:hypothetical protein